MFALFSRILKLSGRYKSRIQGAFVCAFLESILSKMPIFLAFVVLSGFANKTITGQTCLYVGLGLAAIVLVQMLVHYLSDSLQSAAGYLMFADKRIELGGHLRKLPMGYFTSGNIGKISSVLSTDMVFIEEVAMSTLGNMMSYLLSSLVLLAFMFYLNWQLGLIAAIVTILAWLVSKGMNKVSLREAAGRQEQSERLTDAVLSFVEGIGVIKSYNLLGEKSEELSGNFKRSRNTSLDFEQKMTPWTMGLNILYGIGIAAIFGLAIFLEQNGGLSLAYVLGVLLFVFDLFGPLKALYGEASRLTVMNAALDRIEAVLDEPELPDTGKQHLPSQAQPGQPEVQFSDVAFAYQDKEVLHHINFAMKKNSMTALVGPSGGGKSTIANLLARLWDVKSGSVTIRGVDIRNVPLSELMDECLDRQDVEGFHELFAEYLERVGYGEDVPVADFDLIFANILVDGDHWTLIDYEWTFDRVIDTKALAFRAIYCYVLEDERRNALELDRILDRLGITENEARQYREQESSFQKYVTGQKLSMGEIRNLLGGEIYQPTDWIGRFRQTEGELRVQIYEDKGQGFSEENSYFPENVYAEEKLAFFTVHFDGNVHSLRIDPAMCSCMCKVRELTLNGQPVPLQEKKVFFTNGKIVKSADGAEYPGIVFPTEDPNMTVRVDALNRQADNSLSVKMEIVPIPLAMAQDMAGAVKKIF